MAKNSTENLSSASAIGAVGLSLSALGIVFGDIGTSPLYTLKTVLNLTGANPDAATTHHVRWECKTMAKDQKPADQMDAFSKQAMAQAHEALDTYFDFLKKTVSSFPSGGTDLGEKLKDQGVQNITAVHELVKRLSQAKDFEEALRIQTAFMHSQLNALGKQAASLGEAYIKMPFKSSLD